MSEKFFPFPSVNGDRKYGVSDWVGYFAPLITNGVFGGGDKLKVTAGTGLTVSVAAGEACINGYRYTNTTPKKLTLAAANAYYARIDRVIVRWDKQARTMTAQVLTGEPSSAPVAPSLIRTAVVYDICLATVTVPANATAAGGITDTRADKDVCGTVMASDVVIGSKTLNCNGKLMQGDIVVELVGSATSGETWYFNDTIDMCRDAKNVNFKSNGVAYVKFMELGNKFFDDLFYYKDGGGNTGVYDYFTSTWKNEAYRTIVLDEPATGDVLTFLEANATKLS